MAGSTRTVVLYGAHGQVRVLVCDAAGPMDLTPDSGLWGVTGVEYGTRKVVGSPGERVETVRRSPRTFSVPVLISGSSELQVDQFLGELESILDPSRDVRLVFRRPDGSSREIAARYLSGAESLAVKSARHRDIKVPLVFRAHYPFWRSSDGLRVHTETFEDGAFANSNYVQFYNNGDVPAWPEITINGNAENIECANLVTGQVFRIVRVLPGNETVRIDSDPNTFGVYLNNWQGFPTVMDPYSEFWPLLPGLNRLVFRAITLGRAPLGTFTIKWREEFGTA
jgi:phage-related protein